ncbi:hypothetical protein F4703DRAFT_1855715, partial [Phycomyces blakesleeanus]
DRRSCALTCKGWRYPFQKALWKNIYIHDCDSLENLIDMVKVSQSTSIFRGPWVYSLHVNYYCSAPEILAIQFSELFRYLPNLKRLHLNGEIYKYIYTDTTRSDNVWNSLEILIVNYSAYTERQSTKELPEFINTCNMLQQLQIIKYGDGFRLEFGVEDFNNMHQNLQSLSFIDAEMYLSSDFLTTLNTIPYTTPALSVTSLDINSKKYENHDGEFSRNWNEWNPLWLYYFGYKYPNLRYLKLEATDMCSDAISSDERQTMISLFRSNPNAFQHLETFDLTTDRYFESSDLILWELLCALRVPLKHLSLDATNNYAVDDSNPVDFSRIIQSFSETLETLSLTGFLYREVDQNSVMEIPSYCPFLTNLCISGSDVSLYIDDILDRCVALKQLEICGGRLLIKSRTTTEETDQHQHSLRSLTLEKCSIAPEVLTCISFRCRNLKRMDLRSLWIGESVCEKTGCLLIDMSHTFLKTLKIGQVQFHGSDRVHSYDDWASLVLVSELHDNPLSNERDTIKRTEIDSNYPRTECNNITWLYTYNDMEYTGEETLSTTEISKDEANIAIEYYKNFQSNQIDAISIDDSSYNGDDLTDAWKYELYKGYAELRFGKIQYRPYICESDFVER